MIVVMDNCYNLIFCIIATDDLTPPHTPNSSALPDCTSSDQRLVKKKATSSSPSNEDSDVPMKLFDKEESDVSMKLFDKEERSTDVSEREKIRYILYTHMQSYYARRMAR